MVMGGDSYSKGFMFESQHSILDGHFYTFIFCNNCNVCLKRHKINEKEAGKAHLKRLCPYEGKLSNDGCIIKHN